MHGATLNVHIADNSVFVVTKWIYCACCLFYGSHSHVAVIVAWNELANNSHMQHNVNMLVAVVSK